MGAVPLVHAVPFARKSAYISCKGPSDDFSVTLLTFLRSPSISYTAQLESRVAALEQALQRAGRDPALLVDGGRQSDGTELSVGGLEKDAEGHIRFHGRTSLMQLTSTTPIQGSNTRLPPSGVPMQDRSELITNALAERHFEGLANPPELVRALLEGHWCWVQPLFNFIYRPVFTRDLHQNGPYCPYILFNAVLAHSVRWAKADSRLAGLLEPYDNGSYFGREVRANLQAEIDRGPATIPMVQTLLLLSAQGSGQGRLTQAWLYSGMAFRLLEDLGILVDGRKFADSVGFTMEELEVRNRLFWSCYFWDKLLSLYLGRVPVLQETQVSPPRDIMDDTGETDVWYPQGIPEDLAAKYPPMQAHTTSCFIHICSLSEILNQLLLTMYNPIQQSTHAEIMACAALQDRNLARWHDRLPKHLRIPVPQVPVHCPPSHIVTLK